MAESSEPTWSATTEQVRYVPVLLTKHAECAALHDLSWDAKRRMTPLFVVAPVAWSFDFDGPVMSVAEHLAPLPARLAGAWAGGRAFVDISFIGEHDVLDDGGAALPWLVEQAGAASVTLVPVTGPRRSPRVDEIIAEVGAWDDRGLCLRLLPDEWPTRTGPIEFRRLLDRLRADPIHVDLVLDLGDVANADEESVSSAVIYELAVLPFADAWRSVTVVGSSIPMVQPVGVRRVHRREWNVHRRLVRDAVLPRRPGYGDYGVAHPDPRAEIDTLGQQRLVTLRHTVGRDVVIARSHLHEPMPGAGADGRTVPAAGLWIHSNPDFVAGHCAFEDAVQAAAARRHDGEVSRPWRRLSMRHHLEVVAEQLVHLDAGEPSPAADAHQDRRRSGR